MFFSTIRQDLIKHLYIHRNYMATVQQFMAKFEKIVYRCEMVEDSSMGLGRFITWSVP